MAPSIHTNFSCKNFNHESQSTINHLIRKRKFFFAELRDSSEKYRGHLLSDMANMVPCSTHPVRVNHKRRKSIQSLFVSEEIDVLSDLIIYHAC